MGPIRDSSTSVETGILVRYWAGARAAAGVSEETFSSPTTVASLRAAAVERHPDSPRLAEVLAVCSVLVDGRQPSAAPGANPAEVVIDAGSTVEFLPPFAGG